MEKVDSNDIEQISRISVEVQLQLCKEAACAFGYLRRAVCEKFGQKGVEVIENNFVRFCPFKRRNATYRKKSFKRG